MPIRQVLFAVPTFPDAVSEGVMESACTLTQLLGADLTVQVPRLNPDRATWPPVGAYPVDFPALMQEMVVKSHAQASAAAASIQELAPAFGLKLDLRDCLTTAYGSAAPLVDLGRLHDLVVLPVPEIDSFGRACVQAALFGCGRPVVLLPSSGRRLSKLHRIVVAWDFSREAARALADALPLLALAREVQIVTVFGEKHLETSAATADLEKYLAAHQIRYSLHRPAMEGQSIGNFLMDYAANVDADMLVTGGYGHSRLREFVLGGATRDLLRDPRLPVFLSH